MYIFCTIIKLIFITVNLCIPENEMHITLSDYMNKTLSVIKENIDSDDVEDEKIKKILFNIYLNMTPVNKNTLALFTGLVLHNTKFFRQSKKHDNEKYCPRGFLNISGENDYQRISLFTKIDFLKNPELLESFDSDIIEVTVNYFVHIMDMEGYSFLDMMKGLYFSEYCAYTINRYLTIDWLQRETLYNNLKKKY